MPLPAQDIQWPPVNIMALYTKMSEWAAWYSGDPVRIMGAYAMNTASGTESHPFWRFWSRARDSRSGAQRALIHVPIAADLAATSAALLFGEIPIIRVRAAREDNGEDDCQPMMDPETGIMHDPKTGEPATHGSGKPMTPFLASMDKAVKKSAPTAMTPEQKAEARVLQMAEDGDFYSKLVEAAESSAAIGGIYIYPVWDKDLREFPLMGIAQSDMAVPEFFHGLLTAVTFHRTVQGDGNRVWRLIERHEVEGTGDTRKAVVLSAIYQGTEDRLGVQINLGVSDNYAHSDLVPGVLKRVELPFPDLDVEYIPNIRPNRLWRASNYGVADIQGAETLLDALDETYASWMRDIRLAKARILVPREYLRNDPSDPSASPGFDVDQEIYVGMDMEPGLAQDARSMLAHQFLIRYKEHQETSRELIERIVSNAGYSPQTLGTFSEKGTGTGTALRISEHKTLLTLRRKANWWRTAISNQLYRMMLIDRDVLGNTEYYPAGDIKLMRPTVRISDSIIDNPLELAQTALALNTAAASSTETRVRIVHPDWSGLEVAAEVDRIEEDAKSAAPPPMIGGNLGPPQPPGALGAPHTDPASPGNLPTHDPMTGGAPSNKPPASPPFAKKQV